MMKTLVNSTALNNAMKMVAKAIDSKSVLPILHNIIFDVKGDWITLTASNGEIFVTTMVGVLENEGERRFAVDGKSVLMAFEKLPEGNVTIEMEEQMEKDIMTIDYALGVFSLPTVDALEFPSTPTMENVNTYSLSEKILQKNLSLCYFATAQDELRPVMNGIYFDFTTEGLIMVASDGHKLVKSVLNTNKTEEPKSFILPKRPADILMKILGKTDDKVDISFTDSFAVFSTENFTLQCRLIEGRYPNYNSVIPSNNPYTMTTSREDMITTLSRIVPFSNESQLTKLEISSDKVVFSTENYDFSQSATAKISCSYDGNDITIGFKGSMLIDVLKNISSENILLKLSEPSRAALILPSEQPEDHEITILSMPMLIA